ncbi:hypothetical protein ACFQ2M_08810 [Kitasatospora saccharophila]|uniref:hypothetical protein n=1 Tax=Kitasatospora saccharophila TaxID=407973 RepID=UPI00362AB28A
MTVSDLPPSDLPNDLQIDALPVPDDVTAVADGVGALPPRCCGAGTGTAGCRWRPCTPPGAAANCWAPPSRCTGR